MRRGGGVGGGAGGGGSGGGGGGCRSCGNTSKPGYAVSYSCVGASCPASPLHYRDIDRWSCPFDLILIAT